MLIFMILQGTAPREKIDHSRVAKEQRIYCVRRWNAFTCSKSSFNMSAICAIAITVNFSSSRKRCIPFREMDDS